MKVLFFANSHYEVNNKKVAHIPQKFTTKKIREKLLNIDLQELVTMNFRVKVIFSAESHC